MKHYETKLEEVSFCDADVVLAQLEGGRAHTLHASKDKLLSPLKSH